VASAGASLADVGRITGAAVGAAGQSLFQALLNFIPIDAPFALADLYITPVILPCARSCLDLGCAYMRDRMVISRVI
jgi:hypothetical protein